MPGIVDTLLFRFIGSTSHLKKNIASAQAAVQGLTGSVFTAKAVMVGGLAAIGIAALLAFRKSVAAIAGLDAALREVSTLLPGTVRGLDAVRDALIDVSDRTGEPPEMLTEAFYQSTSAGFTNLADSLHLTETASVAAVAGLTDSGTAIDALTTIINAYGLTAADATEVSDKLFTTVQKGKVRFEDLAKNIGTVASTGKILGVSFDTVLASIASLTKNTGQVEESFTALNRAMLGIVNQTDEAKEFAAALGLEITETRVKTEGWLPILQEMNEKIGGSAEAFFKLNPNIRSFKGLVVLAGEGLPDLIDALDALENSAGATHGAMKTINEGILRQKSIIKQKLDNAWKRLGTVTLPIAEEAYRQIANILTAFESSADKRIRFLNELGEGEAALALRRLQLIGIFEKEVDKTADRAEKRLDRVLKKAGVISRGETLGRFFAGLVGQIDSGSLLLTKTLDKVRDNLKDIDFEALVPAARRKIIEEQIAAIMEVQGQLRGDEAAKALEIAAALREELKFIEDQVTAQSTLTSLLDETNDVLIDIGDDGLDLDLDDDAAAAKKLADALKEAAAAVDEFAQNAASLREFGFNVGDEIPGAVTEYLNILEEIKGKIDEQGDAYDLLIQHDTVRAEQALRNIQLLEVQLGLLHEQKDAIIDALRFIDEFGEGIVDVFADLNERQRNLLTAPLAGLEFAIQALRRAQIELEKVEEGTEAWEEAQLAVNAAQQGVDKAFAGVKSVLRFLIRDTKKYEAIIEQIKKAMAGGDGTDPDDPFDWKKVGEGIEASARAALSLFDALGLVDDQTRKVLTGFIDIGDAIAKIASGNLVAGIIQGVGGLVGVIGGLFGGGGPSEEELKRMEEVRQAYEAAADAIENNTAALARLIVGLDNITQQFADIPGALIAGVTDIILGPLEEYEKGLAELRRAREGFTGDDRGGFNKWGAELRREFIDSVRAAFEESGLSIEELREVAERTGLELDALVHFLETGEGAFSQIADQAEQLADALKLVDFEALFEGWNGFLRRLELEFQILDIDDPAEKLRLMVEKFGELTDLPEEFQKRLDAIDLDNLTPEGLAELEALLQNLFQESLDNPAFIAALGELSPEDWIEAIVGLTDSVDGLQEAAGDIEDGSQNVSAQNTITVEQAERQAAILSTISAYSRLMYDELKSFHLDMNSAFGLTSPTTAQVQAFTGGNGTAVPTVTTTIEQLIINMEGQISNPNEFVDEFAGLIDQVNGTAINSARSGVSGFAYRRNV